MSPVDAYSRIAEVYDTIVVDPAHGRWAAFLHELWATDDARVRTVLDVGCGTGLMAAELVALGYRVVGLDASAAMLARARRRLGPDVVLVRETLPGLSVEQVFDAAIATFDALNYLSPEGLRLTLAALAGRIRPGGRLVFDAHTDAMMDFTLANPEVEGEADGYRFTISSAVDVAARTCDTRVEITRIADGDRFVEHHRQWFFPDDMIRGALRDTGFDAVTATEEYGHDPVTATTLRATWSARRGIEPAVWAT